MANNQPAGHKEKTNNRQPFSNNSSNVNGNTTTNYSSNEDYDDDHHGDEEKSILVRLRKPRAILFGFHGTISPVDWEDRCIATYVRNNLLQFLEQNWNKNEVFALVSQLKDQSFDEHFVYETANAPLIIGFDNRNSNWREVLDSVYRFVMWQLNKLRISKETLCLVRMCWTKGYEQKNIQTIVFDDVLPAIVRFKSLKIKLGIFTSMDKDMCRLVLSSTTCGDISKEFDHYFDSETVGNRRDTGFYDKLSNLFQVSKQDILYFCDYGQDVKVACENGLQSVIVLRSGNRKTRSYYLIRFPSTDNLDKIEFV